MEETLDEAEVALEFRVACLGTNWTEEAEAREALEEEAPPPCSARSPSPGNPGEELEASFDHEFALRFLKWREDKRRGGGKSGAWNYRRRTLDEVHESILGKLSAIARHRKLIV